MFRKISCKIEEKTPEQILAEYFCRIWLNIEVPIEFQLYNATMELTFSQGSNSILDLRITDSQVGERYLYKNLISCCLIPRPLGRLKAEGK